MTVYAYFAVLQDSSCKRSNEQWSSLFPISVVRKSNTAVVRSTTAHTAFEVIRCTQSFSVRGVHDLFITSKFKILCWYIQLQCVADNPITGASPIITSLLQIHVSYFFSLFIARCGLCNKFGLVSVTT